MIPSTPMTLGEIFDRLFKLIGKTWLRSLIICSIVMIVPLVVYTIGMNSYFSSIAGLVHLKDLGPAPDMHEIFRLVGGMVLFVSGLVIFLLGELIASLGVTIIGCGEMNDQNLTWQEALNRTFSIRLLRLIGQKILEILAFVGLFFVSAILLIIASIAHSGSLIFFGVITILAAIGILIFLYIKWKFTILLIGWEDSEIIQSFKRSWILVKGNWWRVFGILILLSIILGFAVSLISTPISFLAIWDIIREQFKMISSHASSELNPDRIFVMFKSFGWRVGIISGLTSILELLISPLFVTVLYYDLLAREVKNIPAPQPNTETTI